MPYSSQGRAGPAGASGGARARACRPQWLAARPALSGPCGPQTLHPWAGVRQPPRLPSGSGGAGWVPVGRQTGGGGLFSVFLFIYVTEFLLMALLNIEKLDLKVNLVTKQEKLLWEGHMKGGVRWATCLSRCQAAVTDVRRGSNGLVTLVARDAHVMGGARCCRPGNGAGGARGEVRLVSDAGETDDLQLQRTHLDSCPPNTRLFQMDQKGSY